MSAALLSARGSSHGWQLILADLALILFLLTLSALPAGDTESRPAPVGRAGVLPSARPVAVAAAQALYRPVAGGPGLAEWLGTQPRDPRATLTVFARYRPGGEAVAWAAARGLAEQARGSGVAVRTIITVGGEADLYASLAYDEPPAD
ncbi:hypothetical protein [Erythrobacter dokdonensis]|uniref:Uncharacterized protein n=1 Tax=Erythrobacter dokdonensis DSW-74 TaxID=1300349 RepID=A0A1A7BIA3_9SPHN|nr:hypothetical protein [Erythrobacter dokdonensis]OBV10930.1 hypothetical protein I603_1338 [Erythrobacter dokdonensis DSW-74]